MRHGRSSLYRNKAVLSEAAREEETLRYGASLLVDSVINDTAAPLPLDPSIISLCSDAGLTAFAQLAAFRLNVDRALISLFDGKRQHIVAEATQSTAIEHGRGANIHHNGTESPLLLSGTAVPPEFLMCRHVLDQPSVDSAEEKLLPLLAVPDLTHHELSSSGPYFVTGSLLRSYVGVPLRSPQGIDIGAVCVFNRKPMNTFDAASQRFMRHFSSLVMGYLEARVSNESYQRNERMVRGLGSMVEGLGSMSRWRTTSNPNAFQDTPGRNGTTKEGVLNVKQQQIQGDARKSFVSGPVRPIASPVQTTDNFKWNMEDAYPSESMETLETKDRPDHVTSTAASSKIEDDDNTLILKSVFSRAANIIRESVEVEGALFLDAPQVAFGRLVPLDEDDDPQRSLSGSSGEDSLASDDSAQGRPILCRVLGYANSGASSINDDEASKEHTSVLDLFLDRLSRRYPDGQIFNFGIDGSVIWALSDSEGSEGGLSGSSADDDKSLQKMIRLRPRKSDGAYLMRMFPGASSVALIPLRNSHKSGWFAGGFVWTKSRARVFTSAELSYLKAFGSATMAEVTRNEVLRESKAKEDILGSLSHEIRSPLHGVILGVELLHDSPQPLTGFQQDVISTVETCSRTLLDTLDHLLDFSKVNHFLQKPRRRGAGATARGLGNAANGLGSIEAGMISLFSEVRLDLLTEEVIESVYAGFSFQTTSDQWQSRDKVHSSRSRQAGTLRRLESVRRMDGGDDFDKNSAQLNSSNVKIHLDIDPNVENWTFHAQSGALRRIIMNLFGNALKYTSQGNILVSLTLERFPSSKKKKCRRRTVVISISDSGRGIAADYLKNRLFTPFAQENQLSSGVGLGLSLVKQIVHGLGGRIGVESQVDDKLGTTGTTVRVLIPLRLASSPHMSPDSAPQLAHNDFLKLLKKVNGVAVSLLGFPETFVQHRPLAVGRDTQTSPKAALETLCSQSLRMRVVPEAEAVSNPPQLFLCTAAAMSQVPATSAAVIICDSILSSHQYQAQFSAASHSSIRECISQPVGPRKLAKILALVLKRSNDAEAQQNLREYRPSASGTPEYFGSPETTDSYVKGIPKSTQSLARPTGNGDTEPQSMALPHRTFTPSSTATDANSGSISGEAVKPRQLSIVTSSSEDSIPFLLVDDNPINLKMLSSFMDKLKRGSSRATNGLEALHSCQSRTIQYRCIFMDISMPLMDGLESTRQIRAHERKHRLQPAFIIALSGLASAETQQEAYGSGVDLFLSKPVPLKELRLILEARNL